MTEKRIDLARRLRDACEAAPANARVPNGITAADVRTVADAFLSMEFMVQHLHIERQRIIRAIGMQVEGPDADLDGYPDLAERVADRIASEASKAAMAAQKMWQMEQRSTQP